MSIWLKNEVEKLAVRVAELEKQQAPEKVDLSGIEARLKELEQKAHTHNVGRPKLTKG